MDLTRAEWRTASHSSINGGNCVEVARNLPGIIAVRDSKDRQGPALIFGTADWRAFATELKNGALKLS
jgi:hypothetical protein